MLTEFIEKRISCPYTLDKKDNALKLEIRGRKSFSLLCGYVFVLFLAVIALVGCLFFSVFNNFNLKDIIIVSSFCIVFLFIIYYVIYMINWNRKGKEIYILYPDRLEYITENKPFKSTHQAYYFSKMRIFYNSGFDYFSEEEVENFRTEENMGELKGNYPIRFFMDEEDFIESDRQIPIDVIRRKKKEYLLIQNKEKEELDTLMHT